MYVCIYSKCTYNNSTVIMYNVYTPMCFPHHKLYSVDVMLRKMWLYRGPRMWSVGVIGGTMNAVATCGSGYLPPTQPMSTNHSTPCGGAKLD